MQQHECNKHNYLCINDSLKFYFLVKIRALHNPLSSPLYFLYRNNSNSKKIQNSYKTPLHFAKIPIQSLVLNKN
jgi:hypothetical protein